MTRPYAEQMLLWRYESPYNIYGYEGEDPESVVDYLIEKQNQFFAVLDGDDFIGFRSFGADGQVEGGNYDDQYLDTGGGLRPDLTGKGLGQSFLTQGLQFGCEHSGTNRFRITVAAFNERALKLVRRVGFRELESFVRPDDQQAFVVLVLDLSA
jgi:ribosomal-protein-alanine N-acetyltransferase